jgi:spoIIIJ-associated protein
VKDRVFTGRDVAAALAAAATALGLPETDLRYVVLEAGTPGSRGLQPTPARVAVLLEDEPAAPRGGPGPVPTAEVEPRAGIREVVRAVADAAGIDVLAEIEEKEESAVVRLEGPDENFFSGPDGRGDVALALEHLLQRSFARALGGRVIRVRSSQLQERRDAALSAEARRLGEAVRQDGTPRTTAPLNSYERRIIHLALHDEPGLTTYSVGEGPERRVTVAPAPEAPDSAPPGATPPDTTPEDAGPA